MSAFGRGSRSAHRALGAALLWGVGAGTLQRLAAPLTLEQALAEARELARVHRRRAYVYRRHDGTLNASLIEPAISLLPGNGVAELVAEIDHSQLQDAV